MSSGRMRRLRAVTDHAEVFPDLQTPCPHIDGSQQRLDQAVFSAWLVQKSPVEMAEREEPTGMRPVVALEVLLEFTPPAAVQVHHGLNIEEIHEVNQTIDVLLHPPP